MLASKVSPKISALLPDVSFEFFKIFAIIPDRISSTAWLLKPPKSSIIFKTDFSAFKLFLVAFLTIKFVKASALKSSDSFKALDI